MLLINGTSLIAWNTNCDVSDEKDVFTWPGIALKSLPANLACLIELRKDVISAPFNVVTSMNSLSDAPVGPFGK